MYTNGDVIWSLVSGHWELELQYGVTSPTPIPNRAQLSLMVSHLLLYSIK